MKLSHQIQAESKLSEWKVGALFMEPGTGKTRIAVDLINSTPCDLCIWIAPLRTIKTKDGILSIEDEVGKWSLKIPIIYIGVESLSSSDRIYLNLLDEISKANNPFIVVDESLKIKNAEAIRTKRILEIGKLARYKLILNGTPISKNLTDMWSQMEFLSPKILNMTLNEFKSTFCETTTVKKGRYSREFISGTANVDYLYSLIRHYVYECDLNLRITQNYKEINYSLSGEEKEKYNAIKKRFLSDEMLEWRNNNIFLEMTTLMQHVYAASKGKLDAVSELFESIPEDQSIIFCRFIRSREVCEKLFPKATILSYQKEAYGLNMQHLNHTIYFDKIWDYGLKTQTSRRTYRTGQEKTCYYHDLTGNVGLEKMMDKNINKKISLSEYLKTVSKEHLLSDL